MNADIDATFEKVGTGWKLTVPDLSCLRARMGTNVLEQFCACFVHADRITSLIVFQDLSNSKFPAESVATNRNYLTFWFFLVGTLKELSLDLGRLRSVLVQRGVWIQESWQEGLGRWERWGNEHDSSALRNQFAFHIDRVTIQKGLDRLNVAGSCTLMESDDKDLKSSSCTLAAEAVLQGLISTIPDVRAAIEKPAHLLGIHDELQRQLVSVMQAVGVRIREPQ